MPMYDEQEMDFEDDGDLQVYGARRWLRAPCLSNPTALKRTLLGGAVVAALVTIVLLAHLLFSSKRLPAFEVLRSPSDRRVAEYVVLKNGLRVLLVSDPKCDKAGAAMDVAAGSLDDPEDHEGLAHFLEHMLFLGSAKYPQEGAFSKFMQQHAGATNAYTDQGHTNFHFTVQKDSLEAALDRFAQFFVAPLLSPSGAGREMNAVNAEHKKNLQSDVWRQWQLYKHLANPRHPFHKFSTGSLKTLNKDDTVDQLVAFYERFYTSASTMRLAIVGLEGLEQLEQWAAKYFSAIPQRRPAARAAPTVAVWPTTGLRVDVVPVADLRQVSAVWALPTLQARYRNMVPGFLQHVLAGQAEGSLYQALKAADHGRAVELELQDVRDFALLEVRVALTRAGVQRWEEVVAALFQYLQLVRNTAELCPLWADALALQRLHFRFQEATDTADFLETAAVAMQYQSPADLLGSPQNFACDESLLRAVVEALTPDQMLLFVVSPDHEDLPETEPVYGTRYAATPLPDATLAAWGSAAPAAGMALPAPNQFLPTTFDLYFPAGSQNRIRRLHEVPGLVVWHQPSQLFSQPRLIYKCEVHFPAYRFDPAKLVLMHLYAELLNDLLEPPLYEAGQVGTEGSVSAAAGSLVLTVSGLTEPSAKLWPILLLAWRRGLAPERFRAIKERTAIDVANQKFANAYLYAWRVLRPLLLERPAVTPAEQLAILDGIDFHAMEQFTVAIKREPNHVECLAFGNVLERDALTMAADLAAAVQSVATDTLRGKDVAEWAAGLETAIQSPCPNPLDANSVLLATYQFPAGPAAAPALQLELAQFILDQEAYQRLRTEEQLGYVVFTLATTTRTPAYNMSYYHVLIQSGDYSPDYLDDHVEAFFGSALQLLPTISVQELADFRLALWQQKWPVPLNLAEEAAVLWSEIAGHTYAFDRKQQEYQALQGIALDDVLHTFSAAVATRATRRKVSLLLYGEGLPMGLPQGARAFAEVLNISALPGWAARQRWLPGEP